MNISAISAIYFSPTGTTRKYIENLISELKPEKTEIHNLTRPDNRKQKNIEITSDVVVIGFPVYEEYVPEIFLEALKNFNFNNQPVISLAVYGKIGFGMSLKQIYSVLSEKNLKVITMAALIGEHSFATDKNPLALNRPNQNDLNFVRNIADHFTNKIQNGMKLLDEQKIPGNPPLMSRILPRHSAKMFTRPPVINNNCTDCRLCIKICPVNAIGNDLSIDEKKCIRCFACVKKCPRNGRKINLKFSPAVKTMFFLNERKQKNNIII